MHVKILFEERNRVRAYKIWKMETTFLVLMISLRVKIMLKNRGGLKNIMHKKLQEMFTVGVMCLGHPVCPPYPEE